MNCVDLKERFGKKYRIGLDPAAKHEPGGRTDPWMFTVRCQYGEIYSYGGERLAFHCKGTRMRRIVRGQFPDFEVRNWSDDGEAIFIFHVDQFSELAKIIKPRKKRQVSEVERQRLAEMSKKYSPFASIKKGTSVKGERIPELEVRV